jgi:hypothetical protein
MANRDATGLWGVFIPDLPEGTLYKYVSRLGWCEGARCMFLRANGLSRIQSSLDSAHHSALFFSFHSFRLEKDAMDYALSMVQFLLQPALHLVHAGKQ